MKSDNYLIVEWRTAQRRAIRDGLGEGLVKIGVDERVVVLSGDLAASTRVKKFEEVYPERFFEMGVAEQNMAGVAGGMASEGLIPFISSYAVFSPGRNWEQIRVSVAMSHQNVKIIGGHAGVATGKNGPTHQATEDIALMRALPGMTVIVPADANQCAAAVEASYKHDGPVYVRTTRPETPDFTKKQVFEIGKAQVYREGRDLTICACGIQVWDALMVAEELSKEGIECEVINVASVKPLDTKTVVESAQKTGKVITIEDHQIEAGMGGAIAEVLAEECPVPVLRIGLKNQFGVSGEWEEVYKQVGLDRASLVKKIRDWV
ncbi:MAG: transketolase C-terminal domain-containing protein [bacterium]